MLSGWGKVRHQKEVNDVSQYNRSKRDKKIPRQAHCILLDTLRPRRGFQKKGRFSVALARNDNKSPLVANSWLYNGRSGKLAAMSAVKEVDAQSYDQPSKEAKPSKNGQSSHQQQAEYDAQNRRE